MKILLTHDVDHLHGLEHWNDLYWPGVWYRGLKNFVKGKINLSTYLKRSNPCQRLERIHEVLKVDQSFGATPTFFFGIQKGLLLSYNSSISKLFIEDLVAEGVNVGLHGMRYDDLEGMKLEKQKFIDVNGFSPIGIRNHYLRLSKNTLEFMEYLDYSFDSTTYALLAPYRVNNMWEFPITLMDVSLGIDSSLESKKKQTLTIYEQSLEANLPYFVINFHDLYFSFSYPSMMNWYQWVLSFLSKNHEFTSYDKAVKTLNG